MSLWVLVAALAAALTVVLGLTLLSRRHGPPAGYFREPTRGTGAVSVLGGLLAVLIAFVVLLSLQNHRDARDAGGQEAVATTQMSQTSELFPDDVGDGLRAGLACYGRAVVHHEWGASRDGRGVSVPVAQGWLDEMVGSLAAYEPATAREEGAYSQWFTQDADRRDGRRDRIAGAESLVPGSLWFVLVLGSGIVVTFVVLLSDPRDSVPVQLTMTGAVTALLVCALGTVGYFATPLAGPGAVRPVEMERTLALMGEAGPLPCDATGAPAH